MNVCRVLPHQISDGPANMALDEALLDAVASDPTSSVVRTYEWSVPTLSLGYFQKISEAEADPRWLGKAIVRRPTGGGALWHDREMTYAVVVPASHPLARPSTALYEAVHAAIAARLRGFGVLAERRGVDLASLAPTNHRPFLCFQDHDRNDVVVGRIKLVGSAQRRRAGAVLQHGSLLLARSATTPELPGLTDLVREPLGRTSETTTNISQNPVFWSTVLRDVLSASIGGAVFDQEFTDSERERADSLQKEIYQVPTWTHRR